MSALCPPIVWLPFLFAGLLALPTRLSVRQAGVGAVLTATATLLLVVCGSLFPSAVLCGPGPFWWNDPLCRTLAPLPAAGWFLVALRALQPGEAARTAATRSQCWPVAAQLGVACVEAAIRTDLPALLPLLIGLVLLSARGEDRNESLLAATLGAVPVMVAGAVLLAGVDGQGARWSVLHDASRLRQAALLLLLAPALCLCVWAPLRAVLSKRTGPTRGLFRMLVLSAGLLLALRCSAASPGLAPVVAASGVVLVLLCLLLAPANRSLSSRLSLAAAGQSGFVLLAVSFGGPGGVASACMLLGFQCVLLPVVLSIPSDTLAARLRVLAMLVLIGLPPFGPFAAFLVLLLRAGAEAPLLAAALLLSAALSAVFVLDAARRSAIMPAPRGGRGLWVGCVTLVLAGVLFLGLAMPSGLSDWLLSVGSAGS